MSLDRPSPFAASHRQAPLFIVLAYVIGAALWIAFSDRVLDLLVDDPHLLTRLQTYKGLAFVTVTALILYLLMNRAIRAVRRSEAQITEVIENAPFGVHLYRLEGDRLIFAGANRTADEILKVSNRDFVGLEIHEAFPSLRGSGVRDSYLRVCRDGGVWQDRQVFYEDARIKGAYEVHAFATGPGTMAAFFLDVTERCRLEMAAKEMERVKDEMISSVSHEMRTPLTAMLGYLEFMQEHELSEERRHEFVATVLTETERLNALIGNFLDFQRLRAGQRRLKTASVPVPALLQDVQHLFAHCSERHPVTLQLAQELPAIAGDYEQLRQVFNNLVSNAIKYSPQGGPIELGARDDDGDLLLFVRDRGVGISAEDQERVFQTFYRVDNSDTRLVGGTGLGLALVREIVHLHRGRIWVESVPGEGSTFWLRLPAALVAHS